MNYGHALPQESLPRGYKIYNFGRPLSFLRLHYYILSLSEICPGVEKIFEEIHLFYTFYPKLSPLAWGEGRAKQIHKFLSPYHTDSIFQILIRLAQQFLRRC